MSLKNLLMGSYWFSQPNPAQGKVIAIYLAILFGCLLAGLVVLLLRRFQTINALRALMLRYALFGFTFGIVGLLLFVFRQQRVFFLGWRMWFAVLDITMAVWLFRLLKYTFKRVPAIRAEQADRARKEKYLPKK